MDSGNLVSHVTLLEKQFFFLLVCDMCTKQFGNKGLVVTNDH